MLLKLLNGLVSLLSLVAFLVGAGWLLRRAWRRSSDRPTLVVKWLITAADLAFLTFVIGPLFREPGFVAAFVGVPMTAVGGLVMAIVWVPSMAEAVGRRLGGLYDGDDREPDPEPFFSIAEARRKQGKYAEAEAAVRQQLERFPHHFRGQMLLAEIQAVDLKDLEAAAATIDACLTQPDHAPKNIAFALTRLADWRLKLAEDRDGARQAFERILQLLPETPEAHIATQRLAHLTPSEMLEEARERPTLEVPRSVERLGLLGETPVIKRRDSDPAELAARLVAQLDQFPRDNQTREELAVLYLEEFQRPDLAAEQLEQLIAQPLAPPAQIVKWLNLLADVHLSGPGDLAAARAALQRIVDRDPKAAAAENARRRLAVLGRQLQAKKQSQVLKLGSADPRLGLKGGPYRA